MRILWLSALDKDVMWNQNFYHERKAWGAFHEVVPYGPGFANYDKKKTAQDVWHEQGPFDLVIHQEFFLYTFKLEGLIRLPCPKAAILCDAYRNGINMRKKVWTAGGVTTVMHRYTNILSDWKDACPEQEFIHVPWGVDPDVYKDYASRNYDVVHMGSDKLHLYPARHQVTEALKGSGLRVMKKPHPGGIRFGMSLSAPAGAVTGDAYARSLASGKLGISSGGVPGYLVGKYFTIPACKTALLATPAEGWDRAGFVPDVNMFVLDTTRPIEQIKSLLAAPERVQSVAEAGYNLVKDRHLWSHRVRDLTERFEHAVSH